ncbi:sugar phosphate isomerase/epimerase family protein [Cellulosimicrobium marinum]|uniref:sugar phosphate isomerase/epimerase family protein n=1 Tax=Cellulosimicrobium marinum TaxID=1638992 RepID=UPI001E495690|nr:sugar phosphate isomerase/epimerase family protein [Cellulosimicrobium marinum]MCB7136312.1 sugar phosphate isomerase/epimerase [Cellulosimicrobium marinum]
MTASEGTAVGQQPMPFALGYGTNGFTDHPLDDVLSVLDHEGYDAVALTLGFPHLDPFAPGWGERVDALRTRLAAARGGAGMRVVVETGTRFLLDPYRKHRPTLVDTEADTRMRFLERAVEIADGLDAQCVSFFSGVLPDGATPAQGWALLRERVPRLVEHAHAHGVRLSLEPEPGMLVETVADALRLRDEIGAPDALGITVDVGHCLVVEPDGVVGALRAAAPYLANVQLDDMPSTHHEHRPFGEGEIDLPLVLATLADVGYTGVAAVELPRHSYDAPGLAHRSLAALRGAWDAADRARHTTEVP